MGRDAVLGVNLAAGIAYLAIVDRPLVADIMHVEKVVPPTNVDEWDRLLQFGQQMVVAARACDAVRVVFAEPRRANQWAYSDASDRGALQTAAALALRADGREIAVLHPKSAASALGFGNSISAMDEGIAGILKLDVSTVKHWDKRHPAFSVAAAVAKRIWNG